MHHFVCFKGNATEDLVPAMGIVDVHPVIMVVINTHSYETVAGREKVSSLFHRVMSGDSRYQMALTYSQPCLCSDMSNEGGIREIRGRWFTFQFEMI